MTSSPEVDAGEPSPPISEEDGSQRQIKENLERFERLFGADEDAFEQPTTSRKELWSYYLYYNGTTLTLLPLIEPPLTDSQVTMGSVRARTRKHCEHLVSNEDPVDILHVPVLPHERRLSTRHRRTV